ncbi:MAG: methyltransferase domain-containing protein [Chloroflexota bacterium]
MNTVSFPSFWDDIYKRGDTGWDLCAPTPIFCRLLDEGRFVPGRIIVLGAGSGHDAHAFAQHSFDVIAVDFAAEAAQAMRDRATADAPITIMQADIFTLPHTLDATFDYALEYVCFCAIDPQRRLAYADLIARLLKLNGIFIDLAYPLGAHSGGPPYAVNADAVVFMFERRGFTLLSREQPSDSVPHRRGREELLILQKKRDCSKGS